MANVKSVIDMALVQIGTHTIQEKKIQMGEKNINYVVVGSGNHPVFLMPGLLAMWDRFRHQITNLDTEKLTLIIWDSPGSGKSRPPDRDFADDFIVQDAICAFNFMKLLGYSKYSVIGWCVGGATALILASMHPEVVQKIVLISTATYVTSKDLEGYDKFRDVNNWREERRSYMVQAYGLEYARTTWENWVKFLENLYERGGNICTEVLPNIKNPTLIFQGQKDTFTTPEHGFYLRDHLPNAKLKIFENGYHALCFDIEEINPLIMDFLLEESG